MSRVAAIHRYPVKSMLGETLAQAEVTTRGLVGDRVGAVMAGDRIASAKQIRTWAALLELRAEYDGRGARIVFPDGSTVARSLLDVALSEHLGREVRYTAELPEVPVADRTPLQPGDPTEFTLGRAAPAGGFFDYAPLHLISTRTLEDAGVAQAQRFRANLVLDGEEPEAGTRLRVGDEVVLRIVTPTPRCAVPPLRHGSAPPDPDLLRRLPRTGLGLVAGVYADVVSGGTISVGDAVRST